MSAVMGDIEEQFRDAMAEAGLICNVPVQADGRLHRFHVEGDSPGTRNGWFVLHGDGVPAGAYGSWKGVTGTWRHGKRMSWLERAQHRDRVIAAMRAANLEREKSSTDAAMRAESIWNDAGPADADHPYLVTKRVGVHGLRQHGEHLLVPVRDIHGALMSLQRIAPDGSKRFLPGGRVKGGMHIIGTVDSSILMVEGFATGATLHEITGRPVFVAFNAGNLKPLAIVLRKRWPKIVIVIAADNDHETAGNPGIAAARAAAHAIGGARIVTPGRAAGVSDFNDWALQYGPDEIKRVLA